MKEFNYELPYKELDFALSQNKHLYRIGRGEQGVLLVRPYTNIICEHWRFKDVNTAKKSAWKIYSMFENYLNVGDFIGADMCRKFLEMGFTRARRYANHKTGRKYATKPPYYHTGNRGGVAVLPQEPDALTNEKAQASRVFKHVRDIAAKHPEYVRMRKEWRSQE
ncbi:hypothetical protein [Synechococcus phage DSL-LC02]|nr:hypothetical protein [Synechococcus phage DSL-LC02]